MSRLFYFHRFFVVGALRGERRSAFRIFSSTHYTHVAPLGLRFFADHAFRIRFSSTHYTHVAPLERRQSPKFYKHVAPLGLMCPLNRFSYSTTHCTPLECGGLGDVTRL